MVDLELLARRVQELEEKQELIDRGYHQRMETMARRLAKMQELEQEVVLLRGKLERHESDGGHIAWNG
jgi:hypothetical protein